MNNEETLARILHIVEVHLNKTGLKPTDRFIEDLGFDSLDVVEVLIAVESAFDIIIDDDSVVEVSTINELSECVAAQLFMLLYDTVDGADCKG